MLLSPVCALLAIVLLANCCYGSLHFGGQVACEWRHVVCALGEDTFDAVLRMWDKRPNQLHKDWVQYMTLMVAIHNPQKGSGGLQCALCSLACL